MFVLKKLLAAFLVPPGLFITLLFVAGTWFLVKKNRKVFFVMAGLGLFIWILSLSPVADLLVKGLESAVPAPKDIQGDVVFVLHGAGQRVGAAVAIQKRLQVPLVLSGFIFLRDSPQDQRRYFDNLVSLGVPRSQVILETQSRDTFENIREAMALCRRKGYKRPVVVTSAFHSRRVRWVCRRVEFPALLCPVDFSVSGRTIRYDWRDALPRASSLHSFSLAMTEYLGLLFYRIAH